MLTREQGDRTDKLALRYGLRFGMATAPVGVGLGVVAGLRATDLVLPACAPFLAMLYLPGEAGHWTARRTGTIGSGALAGTIAGGCVGVGISVAGLVIYAGMSHLMLRRLVRSPAPSTPAG
jgi:hypothetical protein